MTGPRCSTPPLNTPGFFSSALLEMDVYEQCFAAAGRPSEPKNDPTTTSQSSLVNFSPQISPDRYSSPNSPLSLDNGNIDNNYAPSPPEYDYQTSPQQASHNLRALEAQGPFDSSCYADESQRYYPRDAERGGHLGSINPLQTTSGPTHSHFPQAEPSPPGSSERSPLQKSVPHGQDSSASPLHDMLMNIRTDTRSVHGQVTPPEDFLHYPQSEISDYSFMNKSQPGNTRTRRSSAVSRAGSTTSRKSRKNSTAGRSDDAEGSGTADQESKRRRFLERNRVAASKCRQKKKMWMQDLEETARTQQQHSRNLSATVANLRDELLQVKGELLKHHGCDCEQIKAYLMSEAAKVVAGVTGNMQTKSRLSSTVIAHSPNHDEEFGDDFDDFGEKGSLSGSINDDKMEM